MSSNTDSGAVYEPIVEVEPTSFSDCPLCIEGFIVKNGVATVCSCRSKVRTDRRLANAGIPEEYCRLSTENLLRQKSLRPLSNSVRHAIEVAKEYVDTYSKHGEKNSLLLIGPLDIGSRIAAGILNDLILQRSIEGRYFDWKELITGRAEGEEDFTWEHDNVIYGSVETPEVVVLNEVAAVHMKEAGEDRINALFNARYKDRRGTIATTEYWNYTVTNPENNGIDHVDYYARRISLGDQIGERARSRLLHSSTVVNFERVDPWPLADILRFLEFTSAVKGMHLPVFVERANRYYQKAEGVRFDELGNIYLRCERNSDAITNRELFIQINRYLQKNNLEAPLPETAAFVQPENVDPNTYHQFPVVTGALIAEIPHWDDGPVLILSPLTTELPDLWPARS